MVMNSDVAETEETSKEVPSDSSEPFVLSHSLQVTSPFIQSNLIPYAPRSVKGLNKHKNVSFFSRSKKNSDYTFQFNYSNKVYLYCAACRSAKIKYRPERFIEMCYTMNGEHRLTPDPDNVNHLCLEMGKENPIKKVLEEQCTR